MPLRKYKNEDGELIVEVPAKHEHCPKCGAGWAVDEESDRGMVLEDERDDPPDGAMYADSYISCDAETGETGDRCGWIGSPHDTLPARRQGRVFGEVSMLPRHRPRAQGQSGHAQGVTHALAIAMAK